MAARTAEQTRRPLTPEAFRKQVSRARQLFAELILAEVRQTLDEAAPEEVREELAELDLLQYLRDFLPGFREGYR